MTQASFSSAQYLVADHPRTLFPLDTTRVLVEECELALREYLDKVLDSKVEEAQFPPQQRAYAAKHDFFLRRTVKLDPVAEFFLYDVVYRNRQSFRPDHRPNRRSFGYRFSEGRPESPAKAYGDFKSEVQSGWFTFKYSFSTDVATYFNSIYHHDLVTCVRDLDWQQSDVEALGQFLRQINSGRSIDCLPHGIHPSKVLGAEFLRFVENSRVLKSGLTLRFLDDIHIFDDEQAKLQADFLSLQAMLGEKGLSLNDAKTRYGWSWEGEIEAKVDEIKERLLELRRDVITASGELDGGEEESEEESEEEPTYDSADEDGSALLDDHDVQYLLGLINSPGIDESDAELVLVLLRDHGDDVFPHMVDVLSRFPGLSKNVYSFVRNAGVAPDLDDLLLHFLRESPLATEYQLFWLSKLVIDHLSDSPHYGDLLMAAYEHRNATVLSRSKVLEIPDRRFGLPELREEHLRSGRSDWQAWASAIGMRGEKPASRNHLLSYFGNGSSLNRVLADCAKGLGVG